MPRRCNGYANDDDPPLKKLCRDPCVNLERNEFLSDITGKQWRIGKTVGVGGFGQIHLASDDLTDDVKTDCPFVAKIETHSSGPLFVEINCYLRIAKQSMIMEWKREKKCTQLGMPHYIASGSLIRKNERYRFLILPKFEEDLENVLNNKKVLNLKTVLTISCQIIDVLEYIHSKGYIHSDIKASNILFNTHKIGRKSRCKISSTSSVNSLNTRLRTRAHKSPIKSTYRNLRPKHIVNYCDDFPDWDDDYYVEQDEFEMKPDEPPNDPNRDQVYLLDYGLACKYVLSNGEHRPYCVDERKAHAGTLLFCSRDAHKGVPTRRSDIESLAYNVIYWLTGSLPWMKDLHDPEIVDKTKQKFIANPAAYLEACFEDYPKFLMEYIQYLQNLQYQETPDYEYCKNLFKNTLREYGYKNDSKFDFDNLEGWGQKQKQLKCKRGENPRVPKFIYKISRPPLRSNILIRKKKAHVKKPMKWSQIWIDPETIIKQAREKKSVENSDSDLAMSIADMDINSLKPTYAMLEIYNKCKEGSDTSLDRVDSSSSIDGYTPAMMLAYQTMKKRQQEESDFEAVNVVKTGKSGKRRTVIRTSSKREIQQAKTRKILKRNSRG